MLPVHLGLQRLVLHSLLAWRRAAFAMAKRPQEPTERRFGHFPMERIVEVKLRKPLQGPAQTWHGEPNWGAGPLRMETC